MAEVIITPLERYVAVHVPRAGWVVRALDFWRAFELRQIRFAPYTKTDLR